MKKISIFLLVVTLLFTVSCSKNNNEYSDRSTIESISSTDSNPSQTITVSEPITESLRFEEGIKEIPQELRLQADQISKKYDSTAVQIAIMDNGKLKYTYEYGYANIEDETAVTSDTKFRVASLSKFITSLVFMNLRDRGKVSVDADISDYFGYTIRNPYYPDVVITPGMLMSHTSSIIDTSEFLNSRLGSSSEEIATLLTSESSFSDNAPGTSYSYSNFSLAIIGAICEKVTGLPFNKIADICLCDPLEIDASFLAYEINEQSLIATLYGNGGLSVYEQLNTSFHPTLGQTHHMVQGNFTSSAKDFLKIIAAFCSHGVCDNGKKIILPATVNEMLESRIFAEGLGSGYGVEKNPNLDPYLNLYSFTGNYAGMYSSFVFDPDTRDGIVILTSGANATYLDEIGIYDICTEFFNLLYPKN